MTEAAFSQTLASHLPEKAVGYCLTLWRLKPFAFRLSKSRHSKAGDFSPGQKHCRITINHDLNPYQFLITYIHEVAHLHVHQRFNRSVEPHGPLWKHEFRRLMAPLLTLEIFPPDLLKCLIVHMQNPKASTFSDPKLMSELRLFDTVTFNGILLDKLTEGSHFKLRGRYFKKGKLRRTRFHCHELKTNRNYLVPRAALVELIQPALI
jgi:hypothetical protein